MIWRLAAAEAAAADVALVDAGEERLQAAAQCLPCHQS